MMVLLISLVGLLFGGILTFIWLFVETIAYHVMMETDPYQNYPYQDYYDDF